MKIYTRTGDKGETSLFGGKRVPKYSLRVEAYGTVDELNSVIGSAIGQVKSLKLKVQSYQIKITNELMQIQQDLFEIGGTLAMPSIKYKVLSIKYLTKRVKEFEKIIDKMTEKLPVLRNFILPGGGKSGSLLHFARTVARRAERRVVELSRKERVDKGIIIYMNRLSDLLFTMARFVNYKERQKETLWTKK